HSEEKSSRRVNPFPLDVSIGRKQSDLCRAVVHGRCACKIYGCFLGASIHQGVKIGVPDFPEVANRNNVESSIGLRWISCFHGRAFRRAPREYPSFWGSQRQSADMRLSAQSIKTPAQAIQRGGPEPGSFLDNGPV